MALCDSSEEKDKDELVVADLVHAFLIPQVDREMLRDAVQIGQRQYILAAHVSNVFNAFNVNF